MPPRRFADTIQTMKTAELKGALLDYWVAKAEGMDPQVEWLMPTWNFTWRATTPRGTFTSSGTRFSSDWAVGGPIIERESISIAPSSTGWSALWPERRNEAEGPTPLIAAMRAFVASKFGEDVMDASTPLVEEIRKA